MDGIVLIHLHCIPSLSRVHSFSAFVTWVTVVASCSSPSLLSLLVFKENELVILLWESRQTLVMVAHACNHSLTCIVIPCLQIQTKPTMVAYACDSSIWKAEAGGLTWVLSCLGLHSEFQASLGYRVRYCLQKHEWNKRKKLNHLGFYIRCQNKAPKSWPRC